MSGRGRLGSGGPAALHDRRLLRQEAPRAQDGEQEATQAQVRRRQGSEPSGDSFKEANVLQLLLLFAERFIVQPEM